MKIWTPYGISDRLIRAIEVMYQEVPKLVPRKYTSAVHFYKSLDYFYIQALNVNEDVLSFPLKKIQSL